MKNIRRRRDSGCAANTKVMNNMAIIKAQMRRLAEAAGLPSVCRELGVLPAHESVAE
jgi:hypothetical protein